MVKDIRSGPRKTKKIALGRGFDALLPNLEAVKSEVKGILHCDTQLIHPNRYQPRIRFSDKELEELCASIKTHGILQPLLVRPDDDGYELIAGERRLRAAKRIGLQRVPVLVKDVSESQLLEMSLIENIQREDLNPIEAADAYHQLVTEFGLNQDEVARRVGKSRPTVTNFLRLRQLSAEIKETLKEGTISMGHARALLAIENPGRRRSAWQLVVSRGLSVRATESLVKRLAKDLQASGKSPKKTVDLHLADIAESLSRDFGTRVGIKRRGKRGRVEIEFYSDEDLDRILRLLRR
jgi:ParB family chromosome partitioning protein